MRVTLNITGLDEAEKSAKEIIELVERILAIQQSSAYRGTDIKICIKKDVSGN